MTNKLRLIDVFMTLNFFNTDDFWRAEKPHVFCLFADNPFTQNNLKINNMADKEKNESQLRETITILNVAVARIEHAMIEGDDSFTSLSQSFVEIINSSEQIKRDAQELEDSPAKNNIEKNCQDISQRVGSSIIAFQFYDKLSQRIALVSKTLNLLTEVLKEPSKTNCQAEWVNLQNTIRSKYTLDSDQKIFDDVLNGMSVEEALKIAVEKRTEDEIEFF